MIETVGGSANCLAPGVHIGEYRLLDVIGEGGFGIVYRARDVSLDRIVAIKEYMPATLAGRKSSNEIHVRSQHRGAFDAGLRSFINEARLLAKFSHPALVHVYRFFEFNGTAYMVMRHYEGQTFRTFLTSQSGRMNQRTLAAIISPILDVVEMLHAADCYHRDIAPDNVFLQNSGMPVLLDFGAARRIIGDMTQALTMVLKPGFAPIEQYVDDGAMPQGAWTDIYQIGAMLYLAITGKPPATSVARMINDPVAALSSPQYSGYSAQFLHGVHRALAVKPQDRPQTIGELKELLGVSTMTSPVFAPWASAGAVAPASPLPPETRSDMGAQPHGINVGGARHHGPEAGARTTGVPAQYRAEIDAATSPQEAATAPTDISPGAPSSSNAPVLTTQVPDDIFTFSGPMSPPGAAHEMPSRGAAFQDPPSAPSASASAAATVIFPAPEAPRQSNPAATTAPRDARKNPAAAARWISIAVVAVAAVTAAVWWGGRDTSASPQDTAATVSPDEQQWQQAQAAGTVAALDGYLEAHPSGAYRSQALALINRLEVAVPAASAPTASAAAAADVAATPAPERPPVQETMPKAEAPSAAAGTQVSALGDLAAAEKPVAKPVGDTGRVVLRVSPWGRISVNGAAQGTTPPLTQLELPEGAHRIEISNPAAASVVRTVQVKKGEPVVLSHQFE